MREIKFRGKTKYGNSNYNVNKGQWVYGHFYVENVESDICDFSFDYLSFINIPWGDNFGKIEVESDTIGQYTCFKDRNGTEIYEGDILHKDSHWDIRIENDKGLFMVRDNDKVRHTNLILNCYIDKFDFSEWEIVGSIHTKMITSFWNE